MRPPARLVLGAAVLAVCAACGGSSGGTASTSGPSTVPSATASAAPSPSGGAGSALVFDDGSPGRLSAVRASDGSTTATLELDTTGAPVTRVLVSAANKVADVTGIEVPMTGSGASWSGQALLPLTGSWTFGVTVQRNDGGFLTEDLANVTVNL